MDAEKFRVSLHGARLTLAKVAEQLDALEAMLDGQPTAAQNTKHAVLTFKQLWDQKYRGQSYVIAWAKDSAIMKRLLQSLPLLELEDRIERYLQSPDPFYTQARHPLALFSAAVNKLGTLPLGGELDDDVAKTKARTAALRGGA